MEDSYTFPVKVGKRGQVTIPEPVRGSLAIEEGDIIDIAIPRDSEGKALKRPRSGD